MPECLSIRIDDPVETNSAAMLKDDGESVASQWQEFVVTCRTPTRADFEFDNLTYWQLLRVSLPPVSNKLLYPRKKIQRES